MVASNKDKRSGPVAGRGARKNRDKDVSWEKRLEIARAKRAAILAEQGEQPVIPASKPWEDQDALEAQAAEAPAAGTTSTEPAGEAERGRDYAREAILKAALARRAQTLARKGQEPDAREREALEEHGGPSANVFPLFTAEPAAAPKPEADTSGDAHAPEASPVPEPAAKTEETSDEPQVDAAARSVRAEPEPARQQEIDTTFAARFRSAPEEEEVVSDDFRTQLRRATVVILLLVTGAAAGFWGATFYFTQLGEPHTPAREIPVEGQGGTTPKSSSGQGRVKQAQHETAPVGRHGPMSEG